MNDFFRASREGFELAFRKYKNNDEKIVSLLKISTEIFGVQYKEMHSIPQKHSFWDQKIYDFLGSCTQNLVNFVVLRPLGWGYQEMRRISGTKNPYGFLCSSEQRIFVIL